MASGANTATRRQGSAPVPWSAREREVLDLIARGRTNGEIAESLGITFATAKWHVSQLISKAGVSTREDVAEYWREERSLGGRIRSWRHGLAGLPLLKIGAGVATAAAGVAMFVALMQNGPGGGPSAPAGAVEATATATPTPQSFVTLADCPITTVATPYVARPPYLAQPPEYYDSVWYGSDALWTMLDLGEGWPLQQKTWWWSRNFEIEQERAPKIMVTGTRLDAPGSFTAGNPGTHAYADFGTAMLVGVDIPSTGCWEIRASYKGAELAYVVLVE